MSGARSQLIMEIFLLHAGTGRKGRGKMVKEETQWWVKERESKE